jgi:ABC-type glycerol-3-phosphate transport system substrate-binding protein
MLLPPVAGGIETNFMLADMDGLGVSSRSADPELAKDFLAYVSSREIQSQDWFLGSAGVSPRADVEFPASIDAMKADQFSNIQGVGSSGQLTVAVPYNPAIPKSLARMLAGELTPQAVAETLEGKVQAERARG